VILDHVDGLVLPNEQLSKYGNELNTLRKLGFGLYHLYRQVQKVEQKLTRTGGLVRTFGAGNIPGVPEEVLALVMCAFHWYAVSACNYVWLVGWLARDADKGRKKPHKYANDVMPAVVTYRHKVAAHLARVQPEDDTEADIIAALLSSPIWADGRFFVGGWNVIRTKKGIGCKSKHDLRWSLTLTHADLAKRYRPLIQP
jgi:hypothetical protein